MVTQWQNNSKQIYWPTFLFWHFIVWSSLSVHLQFVANEINVVFSKRVVKYSKVTVLYLQWLCYRPVLQYLFLSYSFWTSVSYGFVLMTELIPGIVWCDLEHKSYFIFFSQFFVPLSLDGQSFLKLKEHSFLYEHMWWNALPVDPNMVMWCVIFPKGESMVEANVLNYSRWKSIFIVFLVAEATVIMNCYFVDSDIGRWS